jgi:DNA-binding CsgD family transcriptional regulator
MLENSHTPSVPLAEALLAEDFRTAQQALGDVSFAAARAQGRTISLDEAIVEVLELDDPAEMDVPSTSTKAPGSTIGLCGLTPTEIRVLRLLAAGRTTKQIGVQLYLAVSTVERHITHVYDKIGSRGKAAATAFALSHDLIEPADVITNELLDHD